MNQQSILHDVHRCLSEAGFATVYAAPQDISSLYDSKGAYVLLIELDEHTPITLPRRDEISLSASTYLYVGSANGPGGIRARLMRHFKKHKKIHWHVDQLTTRAVQVSALAVPTGNECILGETLIGSGRFDTAISGFGSSDCHTCASHLLQPTL